MRQWFGGEPMRSLLRGFVLSGRNEELLMIFLVRVVDRGSLVPEVLMKGESCNARSPLVSRCCL